MLKMRRRLNSRAFDPFDEWLESQGLYRKQVARDGSCLFRAVAEQVLMTQTEHVKVRALCLEYMMLYKDDFQPFLDIPLDHHVFKLQDVREWGGHTEIIAMSRLFQVDFLIYQEIGQMPVKATENSYPKTLMLSYTHGNHYDIVYQKDAATTRGFCQSVVYDILYSHVFQLKDVLVAVDTMLHDKEYASLRRDSANSAELKEIGALVEKIMGTSISRDNSQDEADKNTSIDERPSLEEIHPDDVRGLLARGIPPFPYKVAKSLDPDIYRNIEFDAWNTVRREARYGPFDSNGFQAGVKVFIKLELLPNRQEVEEMRRTRMARQVSGENHDGRNPEERVDVYHGHIQEMSENKGPVDVYVEEIGSRLKVPYDSLEKVPPSPPRSPWHSSQQHLQAGTGSGGSSIGANIPSYKKLSGFYQKAPLPAEPEYSTARSKKKGGKQMREVLTLVPVPAPLRYCGPSNTTAMRGRAAGSPTPHGHSPRSRTPQGSYPQQSFSAKNYCHRGMGLSNNSNYSSSPARDGFPSLTNRGNVDLGVEGVWAVRPSATQSSLPSASNVVNDPVPCSLRGGAYCPPTPQPSSVVDETDQQMREVTLEALQQVMSAGGQQEVRVIGQQLEVVNAEKRADIQESSIVEGVPHQDTHASTSQMGSSSSSQNAAMYTLSYPPPFSSPGLVQVFSPVPPTDESDTPTEFTPPPTSAVPTRADSWDLNAQGTEPDATKMNQGLTPFVVYHMPVMYGGYGYGYNQQWAYSYPVMPSPAVEDGKHTPLPGSEGYHQIVAVGGWGQGYAGDYGPVLSMPGPPHQNYPPIVREPSPLPYPPPPYQDGREGNREGGPFHHHHYRGRGRGGPHHYNHVPRGSHHNNHQYSNNYQGNSFQDPLTMGGSVGGMGRGGGGQRSLPPRFQRGVSSPRHTPPHLHQRNHQYEGQPLMHMGSRKSSSDSLASQDTSLMPSQDHMSMAASPGYFTAPPGYVVSGPWIWKV
ncbi:uncharacterized protein [Procambarus clarkii]|uniref:uncharacterized protein isoform X16 n=1 Tax=Procambarus clarkii TaxID=6728 RepID=UPI00374253EF